MEELKGYVQIYTGYGGYEQFIIDGCCHGTVVPKENFIYPIIVPREAVATRLLIKDPENPPEYIHVDLKQRWSK